MLPGAEREVVLRGPSELATRSASSQRSSSWLAEPVSTPTGEPAGIGHPATSVSRRRDATHHRHRRLPPQRLLDHLGEQRPVGDDAREVVGDASAARRGSCPSRGTSSPRRPATAAAGSRRSCCRTAAHRRPRRARDRRGSRRWARRVALRPTAAGSRPSPRDAACPTAGFSGPVLICSAQRVELRGVFERHARRCRRSPAPGTST